LDGLKSWLAHPDQFNWITEILRERGLLRSAQRTLAAVCSLSVLVPASSFATSKHRTVEIALVDATAAVFIIGVGVFFLMRWPNRIQSAMFGTGGALCIAGWSLTQSSVVLAAVGCCAMATNGGYVALFHSNKLLAFNVSLAVVIAVAAAVRLNNQADAGTALAAWWVIWILNVSVPAVMRGMSGQWALMRYAPTKTR
jgi:hypothetical protein